MPRDIQHILVPVDLSALSELTLGYAAFVARRFAAHVDVLHVWQPPLDVPLDTALAHVVEGPARPMMDMVHEAAARDLDKVVAMLEGAPSVGSRIETGNPVDMILTVADELPYDLIIMGTHGRTGVAHLVMGSVAERVLRRAHCPVLTLRSAPSD